jgi:PmbA protein
MIDKLREGAETLLAATKERGADEAQVIATWSSTARVAFEKNDFNISTTGSKRSFSLKVHKDKRKGSSTTNELGAEALAAVAERAITLASFSLPDEYLTLPEAAETPELPGRFDPELSELSAEKLHAMAAGFVAKAQEDDRISLDGAELEVQTIHECIANSRGLRVSDSVTRLGWSLMGMGKTETEVTSFDYLSGGAWALAGADTRAKDTAGDLCEKLLACFGPKQAPSYKGAVLLSPASLGELIFQPLMFHISGSQIMDGKSRWEESLGEQVAAAGFSLSDDPGNLQLGAATPYDAEGVPVTPTRIIDKGVLKTHIDSSYTAKRRGTKTTGHAGGLHGICVAPGERSLEAMRAEPEQLVVVGRFSGNVDPVSGDFSGVVKNSHYFEKGEYRHPLTETMIAGNFFDLLKDIVAASDSAEPFCNAYQAPWLLVKGISVTSA